MDKKARILAGVALVVYLVATNPAVTGIGVHEWLCLGLFAVFVAHGATQVNQVVACARSVFKDGIGVHLGIVVLDALIVFVFMACMVSGLMISGAVLQALGYYARGYYVWDPLHALAAKVLLALLLLHVVVHWKWIASWFVQRKGSCHDKIDG